MIIHHDMYLEILSYVHIIVCVGIDISCHCNIYFRIAEMSIECFKCIQK